MLIDYGGPYTPSGVHAPMKGDFVHVVWEAPVGASGSNIEPWRLHRFARLTSTVSEDPMTFDKGAPLPHHCIVSISQWNGKNAGRKSW